MAVSALAAIAAAAATTYAGVQGSENAQAANKTSAGISGNNLQNAQNQQQYQHMLDMIAMQRGVAGSTDSRGDQLTYDPATNSWKTLLSPSGQALQTASDSATLKHNLNDVQTASDANNGAMLDAIKARGAAGSALDKLQAFKPMSGQGLEGALQETATTANRQVQDPIIADTLRQFARSGTAAGPVLTNMMRDNATSLRQTMLGDQIDAMKNVDGINNSNRASLAGTYEGLNNASKPALNFASPVGQAPNDALLQEMTARANGSAQPASTAAYSLGSATNANNLAAQDAAKNPGQSNAGATLLSGVDGVKNLFSPTGDVASYIKSLTQGSGNAGDAPPIAFGTSNLNSSGTGMFGLNGPV